MPAGARLKTFNAAFKRLAHDGGALSKLNFDPLFARRAWKLGLPLLNKVRSSAVWPTPFCFRRNRCRDTGSGIRNGVRRCRRVAC